LLISGAHFGNQKENRLTKSGVRFAKTPRVDALLAKLEILMLEAATASGDG
jgi:ATP-dependent protease HslVU (ClpYQ) peptidase subunit